MGILDRARQFFKGDEPQEYHIDPDKTDVASDAATGIGAETGAVSNNFEAQQNMGQTVDIRQGQEGFGNENLKNSEAKSRERMSFDEITKLGSERAQQAQQRRVETRQRWGDNIKGWFERAKGWGKSAVEAGKSGIEKGKAVVDGGKKAFETGKALYYAKDELFGEVDSRINEFANSKVDAAGKRLEAGFIKLSERGMEAIVKLADKLEAADNFIDTKLAERAKNKENAKVAQLVEQRRNFLRLYRETDKKIKARNVEKAMPASGPASGEMATQLA